MRLESVHRFSFGRTAGAVSHAPLARACRVYANPHIHARTIIPTSFVRGDPTSLFASRTRAPSNL